MFKYKRLTIVVVSVLAVFLLAASLWKKTGTPEVGSAAPDFSLIAQNGKATSLKDFRGKWVVLYFYPANFTKMGNLQAVTFERDLPKYVQENAAIVGISPEDAASNKSFAEKKNLTFPVLADADLNTAEQYGSTQRFHMKLLAARNTFIIDPKGNVAQVFLNVDPEVHSGEVLQVLNRLQHH